MMKIVVVAASANTPPRLASDGDALGSQVLAFAKTL
jgi:hypothetical protein